VFEQDSHQAPPLLEASIYLIKSVAGAYLNGDRIFRKERLFAPGPLPLSLQGRTVQRRARGRCGSLGRLVRPGRLRGILWLFAFGTGGIGPFCVQRFAL